LGLQLFPVLLTALAWPMLPAGRKHFFVFPLAHYFAGTTGAAFGAIAAGPTAAAIFWLLLFFVLFRMRQSRAIDFGFVLPAGPLALHEAMVFLGPVLALAVLWRAAKAEQRGDRIALVLLAALFVAGAIVHADFIARPRFVGHGAGFLGALLAGGWAI